jgi:poly(hydroxyalkanoate) depolymerase family esterase
MAAPAAAASLQPVSNWGSSGVPPYVSMYIYVPNQLATNPPILVVAHYCGGTASGVFNEAQGGGIVAAADKYGFIMIFPQTSNNCWDVGSMPSLTHDGGGDTQAVAEMVTYTIATYSADANRVYVTGTSSGAMMTEALLAVYPDVFKAGAEFSGVPAGCWAASYSASDQWSGPCANGQVTHTAPDWGSMVRAMDPGYSGYRARVQLWHGTADAIINFNNQTEAIKEWTDVLGLSTNPTSTTTVTLDNHQWSRQSWQNACGFTVLDAWSEQDGPHGTDANLNATYVIPFLGLDKSGLTDPEVAPCGAGGAGGSGGGPDGGSSGAGGTQGAGGSRGSGGQPGAGGSSVGGAGPGGGAGGDAPAGTAGGPGSNGPAAQAEPPSGGCSCALGSARPSHRADGAMAALAGLALWALVNRRPRRRRQTRDPSHSRAPRRSA